MIVLVKNVSYVKFVVALVSLYYILEGIPFSAPFWATNCQKYFVYNNPFCRSLVKTSIVPENVSKIITINNPEIYSHFLKYFDDNNSHYNDLHGNSF